MCSVTFCSWDPGCDETFLQAVSELAAGEGFARSVEEKGGVGPRCWAVSQVTRHGAGRANVSPGGVEMKSVAAAKSVCRATHDAEKYFSLGRLDIREGGGSAGLVQSGTSSPTRKKPKKARVNAVQYSSWSVGSYKT